MNEREQLLETILDNPDDDVPRLVFADWLEENGEEIYAKLIRLQIEQNQVQKSIRSAEDRNRAADLGMQISDILRLSEFVGWIVREYPQIARTGLTDIKWQRGFIKSFECDFRTIVQCRILDGIDEIPKDSLEYLFQSHPIKSVKITGRFPIRDSGNATHSETYSWDLIDDFGPPDSLPFISGFKIPKLLVKSILSFTNDAHGETIRVRFDTEKQALHFLNDGVYCYLNRYTPNRNPARKKLMLRNGEGVFTPTMFCQQLTIIAPSWTYTIVNQQPT